MSDVTKKETIAKEDGNIKSNASKKKSKIAIIALVVVLMLCAITATAGYMIYNVYNKGKEVVNNEINGVEDVKENIKENVTEESSSFEEIQKKIRVLTEKAKNGKISQEEFQKELAKLQAESLKLQLESK